MQCRVWGLECINESGGPRRRCRQWVGNTLVGGQEPYIGKEQQETEFQTEEIRRHYLEPFLLIGIQYIGDLLV